MLPWRFGGIEEYDSFIFVRVTAFASRALFASSADMISIGDPLVGFLEPSSGETANAQLVSWRKASFDEWRFTSANTMPPSPWNFSSDIIFMIPQLSAANLSYTRLPHALATFVVSPPVSSVLAPYSDKYAKYNDVRQVHLNIDRAQSAAYFPGTVISLVN